MPPVTPHPTQPQQNPVSFQGVNRLEVRVTNSMANTFDGRQLPSGLLGPVVLRAAESWS